MDIAKQYSPRDVEGRIYGLWLERNAFRADTEKGGLPYSISIPPPNVTAILHLGHALNNVVQDILIRWKRLEGRNALWMPGTDHAGIATQNVVEKNLAKDGRVRQDLGREKFLDEVWAWRDEYGGRIIEQLKALGCSCDWDRTRFTMDEGYSRAVVEVFARLYEKGLIYRGNYIINWCPRCQTALSDEEAEHDELQGALYYIRYPIAGEGGKTITVATTRPETMLGDVAVAVHPGDLRHRGIVGKELILPVVERRLSVIEDDFVDPEFGTGVVKVTPAHDPNDFEMGRRHKLDSVNVMNDDGTMNEEVPEQYRGMDRLECREALVVDLKERGLLEKVVPHVHSAGHCYRCHTLVEPRLSLQWFVRMKPLAKRAIEVVESGEVRFYPERWKKVYLDWMNNIRDWCISRQIWWGHRIPVWYCGKCGDDTPIVSAERPGACPSCGGGELRQDEDVLDTWFSSWLWPFATLGWPEGGPDLDFYYPTACLVTAPEILFFWVARMIMAGLEFTGSIPFSDVFLHGTVRDDTGKKMSKSLGNTIDPLLVVSEYGADALRFTMTMTTAQGQDVYISLEKFELGRNFCNKMWNAARFLLAELSKGAPVKIGGWKAGDLSSDDRFILGKLQIAVRDVEAALSAYRLNDAAQQMYAFFWHDFCDRYIEYSKPVLRGEDERSRERVKAVLVTVLSVSLKLLHPVMPFITEEIWQLLSEHADLESDLLALSSWPVPGEEMIDVELISEVEEKYDVVRSCRNLRKEYGIPAKKLLRFVVVHSGEKLRRFLDEEREEIRRLVSASGLEILSGPPGEEGMVSNVTSRGSTVFMDLTGAADVEKEKKRLEEKIRKLEVQIAASEKKLANGKFLERAPAEVVEREREKLGQLEENRKKLRHNLGSLCKPL